MSSSFSSADAQQRSAVARELFETYATYRMTEIVSRRFTQADMLRWLESFRSMNLLTTIPLGQSAEGRTISLLRLGTGSVKVFLWS